MTIKPINLELDKRFQDRRFRERFITTSARDLIASQIRELRLKRGFKNQTEFAKAASMHQSAVARIEKADYGGWSFKTLLKVAFVLRARLKVTFEPLEDSIAIARQSELAAELQQETFSDSTSAAHGLTYDERHEGGLYVFEDETTTAMGAR
jgi:transcriptional regulator with XRE-family HTH domain